MRSLLAAFLLISASSGALLAETELSFYGGLQGAPHSGVSGSDPGGIGDFSFNAAWEGRSFTAPPHYGFRYTRWTSESFGWGIDFNHVKVYADDATLSANGVSRLEFSDGLNILTVNAYRRFPDLGWAVKPYVGAGIGISVPHVEFTTAGGTTFEYQLTGPAVQWVAGASYPLNDRWSVFGEYKGTYSVNEAELSNGGTLSTNILTNALNVGVSLGF